MSGKMAEVIEQTNSFIGGFSGFERGLPREYQWFASARRSALERLSETGFPTTSDEEWRFTNVSPIVKTRFGPPQEARVTPEQIGAFTFDGACRLVFVNGRFAPDLSSRCELPDGVVVSSLGEALRGGPGGDVVKAHLVRHASLEGRPFLALNTAYIQDGTVLQVPRGLALATPIHLLYLSVPGSEPWASHPRTLILAGEGSQVDVVETYAGIGDGVYFTNAVTEVVAGENTVVNHYRLQQEAPQAFHVGTHHLHQARSSNTRSLSLTFGAALCRVNIHAVLDGEGCESTLNGLYMAGGSQHVDHHLRVEHAKPHCDSREYYKGILDDQSHGVFTGRIVVHKDAQKTDAKQTNMNLLLSEQAIVDTKPQLEIFADDVKCTHGATIGQIDSEALFYLRSRGVSEDAARSMLIFAFANESLEQIRLEPVREKLQDVLFARLPGGARLRGAV